MGTLSKDLKDLLAQFSDITQKSFSLLEENDKYRQILKTTELQLKEKVAASEKLMTELQQKQEILDLAHRQLSIIPELRVTNERQLKSLGEFEQKLEMKEQEIAKMKQKHLNDLNSLRLEIEDDRRRDREEETKRITEMDEFYRHAQSTEVSSLIKRTEREKQMLMDQLAAKDKELSTMKSEHKEELEKLRIQAVTKAKDSQSSSATILNSEFYRKKILSMQEHYEQQIQELLDRQSNNASSQNNDFSQKAFKKTKIGNTNEHVPEEEITLDSPTKSTFNAPQTIPSCIKKKKVTFNENVNTSSISSESKTSISRGNSSSSLVNNVQSVESSISTSFGFSNGGVSSSLNEDFWSNLEAENQASLVTSENNNQVNPCSFIPTYERSKTNNRFKFSKKVLASSSQYNTEFGTFHVTSSKKDNSQPTGKQIKRKLFTDPFGPQQL